MATTDIKIELKKLIDQEADANVLEALKTLLIKTKLNATLQEKLISRALKSEEDINNQRVYNQEEIKEKTKQFLNR
jgi:hypothetical protein